MNNLDFYYVSAENFVCFGDKFELDLRNYGKIVSIRGENLDVPGSRNGVGKSTIPEIIVYTLFGTTLKKLSQEEAINNKICKKLRTEVRWGKYRVVRTRKPNTLRIWASEEKEWEKEGWSDHPKKPHASEITKGGIPATQEYIDKLIQLSFDSFVNVFVFSDNNTGAFLECPLPVKREIVENLLSLSAYRAYSEQAKKMRNECDNKITNINKDYDYLLNDYNQTKNRIEIIQKQEIDWLNNKKVEFTSLMKQVELKKHQLASTDTGLALHNYNEAQESIKNKTELVEETSRTLNSIKNILTDATAKTQNYLRKKQELSQLIQNQEFEITVLSKKIASSKNVVESFLSKKDQICPSCLGKVKEENYQSVVENELKNIAMNEKAIAQIENELITPKQSFSTIENHIKTLQEGIVKIDQKVKNHNQKIHDLHKDILELNKIKRPEAESDQKVLEGQIEELKKQISQKKKEISGPSPYAELLKNNLVEIEQKNKKCIEKRQELVEAEKELPYYEFWTKGFGDAGIRKFVIDGIIPVLNAKIAYWLDFLIDGKLKLTFDNELKETIERNPADGEPLVYAGLSGGERRRLNLAVSQAFAHVMTVNSGAFINLVFLDEVTSNVCPVGVEGIFNMIQELAKTKQVFVTTHDQDLLEMLNGCDVINLVKKEGFTKLV